MEISLLLIRLILAAVFAVAGMAKLLDHAGSEKAFAEFGVPSAFVRPLAYLLPAAELFIAASLLFIETSWFGAIGATGLFLVFTSGMLYQMAKGNAPDCHCFGQIHSEPVGATSVLRNVAFLVLAIFLFFQGKSNQGLNLINSNQDIMQFVIGISVVGLLAAAVFFLKRISEQQTQIMRRIEVMELVARDGNSVERDDVGHPHEGLPIGAQFPSFELPDLGGKVVSLNDLKAGAKPTLFFFVSPSCTPCKSLVPEFEQWQSDLGDKVKIVFVSNGKPGENIEKFGDDLTKQFLIQKDREVADSVRAQWTPTAVFMDAKGRIASNVAAGDTAIRELVEWVRAEDLEQEFTHYINGNGQTASKIGTKVPDFSLTDIKGQVIKSDYFNGKQTLVTFWSLTCPFCLNMMDEIREWDKTKGKNDPQLLIFSDGEKDAHDEFELRSPIVLDEGHKTSAGFGMYGTPSAVLVNEYGKIVSETAVGAPDIWSLIGKRK
ncbi:MAG: redoxin domain-containing protein [Pyrinomonadaceae bacterium]